MNIIEVKNLRFSYDGVKMILDDIDFTIEKGENVGIVGDSGCGKSTLCHVFCGRIPGAIGGENLRGMQLWVISISGRRS